MSESDFKILKWFNDIYEGEWMRVFFLRRVNERFRKIINDKINIEVKTLNSFNDIYVWESVKYKNN
jgi:hypothetical protein